MRRVCFRRRCTEDPPGPGPLLARADHCFVARRTPGADNETDSVSGSAFPVCGGERGGGLFRRAATRAGGTCGPAVAGFVCVRRPQTGGLGGGRARAAVGVAGQFGERGPACGRQTPQPLPGGTGSGRPRHSRACSPRSSAVTGGKSGSRAYGGTLWRQVPGDSGFRPHLDALRSRRGGPRFRN